MPGPTVFISYSHDSPEHTDRVLAFADQLISDGIDCILDQYETSPPEGWTMWMDRHIRKADFVLMICTEPYFQRVMGEEEPGQGDALQHAAPHRRLAVSASLGIVCPAAEVAGAKAAARG